MKIGDKVVCVDDSPCKNRLCKLLFPDVRHSCPGLTLNQIYVIRKFHVDSLGNLGIGVIGIGEVCPVSGWDTMAVTRFRLLDELKQQNNVLRCDQRGRTTTGTTLRVKNPVYETCPASEQRDTANAMTRLETIASGNLRAVEH